MNLSLSVETVKGIGPKTAAILKKAGILTLGDLLYTLPRTYENHQSAAKISEIRPGKVTLRGKISDLNTRRARRRNLSITEGVISDDSGAIRVVWFNQSFRRNQFDPKKEYFFQGLYELKNGRYQLTSPTAALAQDIESSTAFQPVYVAHGGLKSTFFRRIFEKLRPEIALAPDLLPLNPENPLLVTSGARADALFKAHFPANETEVEQSRAYLAYEELFQLLLAANLNKQEIQQLKATKLPFNREQTQQFTKSLPFTLTNAQRAAGWQILQDLEKSTPMNRLLQGDVGSGKTVVAALAAHQTAKNGHQTALLAPTAVLAAQHAKTLEKLLAPLGVSVALLTGSTKNKPTLKKQIEQGNVDLVVGTHALLTDDTIFHSLALCIIDEQHRFGVAQRQKLLLKSPNNTAPHLLSMTATPIPRSLQLTVFGDLDVSVISELPKGRQPITTKILAEINQKTDLYPKITETLQKNHQIYWICPAIEDDPKTETASVKKEAERLKSLFKTANIAFLHGRQKPAEKDEIMADFAAHKIDILVSTTVVEVGVDVPNATMIVITNAEHYGLAQLHQLRGRVGRGDAASSCYLLTSADTPPSRRLKELEKSTDGFHLAEVDLKLRGPGEIYGQLQHGALDLRIASLADTKTIALAAKYAKQTAAEFAKNPENMLKYKELMDSIHKYQQLTTLN